MIQRSSSTVMCMLSYLSEWSSRRITTALEFDDDLPVADDVAASDWVVHDVEEGCVGPPTFIPLGHQVVSSEQPHWGEHSEIHPAEGELKIELADTQLSGDLADDRGQVRGRWGSGTSLPSRCSV